MPMPLTTRTALLALLLALGAACSDSAGPPTPPPVKPPAELNILKIPATAPPLAASSTTFTACKGQDAEGRLSYAQGSGGETEDFAKLKIGGNSLLTRPDGTPFAVGDCVDITMAIDDPTQVLVRLEPSGLKFRPDSPAELRLEYAEAEGVDTDVEQKIAIWVQEKPGDLFTQLGSAVIKDQKEVEAKLRGFSRFAIAY